MNSKQRFTAAAKNRVPDVVPVVYYALGSSRSILKGAGLNWRETYWSGEAISRVMQKAHEIIPHDNVCSFLSPICGLDALGVEVKFSDAQGPHIDFNTTKINSWEDLERLEVPDPKKDGSMPARIKAAKLLSAEIGKNTALLGGFGGISTWAMLLRGAANFSRDTRKNPEFQNRYMKFLTDCAIEFCVAQVEEGCDWIISAEDAFAITVLDPERAWKVNGVHARRLARAVKDAGAGYIIHCCGDARLSLLEMIKTKADVLSLDKVDLAEAKEKVEGKAALMGNINLQTLLYRGPGDVQKECRAAIDKAFSCGGYLLSSGYIYPPNTPVDNILSLIDSARKFGRY